MQGFNLLVGAAAIAALVLPAHASPERVRFLEGAAAAAALSPAELNEEVKGYLQPSDLDLGDLLPPPPAPDSAQDKADVALLRAMIANGGEARWQKALADDASVYDRFADQLGIMPDRKRLPRLVRLLNRVSEDVLAATSKAKKRHPRPRPFQRFALARVCGEKTPPKPEASPTTGTSYPSGHASLSWAVALVMMEAAPMQAGTLISRAAGYGNSRVVCGLHFPSDVEAGRITGAAIVDKLLAVPDFRRDLRCAKTEYAAVTAGERSEDLPACQ
jgi:acid phosphatase (class A)